MSQTKQWIGTALALMLGAVCWGAAARQKMQAKALPPEPPASYVNPVLNHGFPDPSLLRDQAAYYAYATNGAGGTVQCARSSDLVHWTDLPNAMPSLPTWANPGRTWAPQVRAFTPGKRYVLYFCAWSKLSNAQAIGVAVAASPEGPFVPAGETPLIDQRDLGGCIDPSCFEDNGSRYLTWKNDGNSRGQDTWLWVQKLSPDGLSLLGTPTRLIKQDKAWEGSLIEAPTLWKHGANYYLFYSANNYTTCDYAVGYATAPTVFGPYTKPRDTPWLSATAQVCGPGGEDIVTAADGQTWMAYHSWENGPKRYRAMSLDPLVWNGDVPYLLGPSRWPQPVLQK